MVAKKTANGKSRYYKQGSLPHASATINSDVDSRRKKIIVVAEEEEEANEDEDSNEGYQNESTKSCDPQPNSYPHIEERIRTEPVRLHYDGFSREFPTSEHALQNLP